MHKYRFLILAYLFFSLTGLEGVISQTYTSNSNGDWNTPAIWIITNTGGCGTPIPANPPVATNNRSCPIVVVINHNVNNTGSLNLGNNNSVIIQIATNKTLSIKDNLSATGYNNKNLSISGSGTLVTGKDLTLSGNSVANFSGNLNIEVGKSINVSEASQFVANGTIMFTSEDATINGNGSLNFQALWQTIFKTTKGDFDLRGGSSILFSGSSGIISAKNINIYGNTPTVRITGSSFLESSQDISLQNGSILILEDNSRVDSGRDMVLEDQVTLQMNNDASVSTNRNLELLDGAIVSAFDNSSIIIDGDVIMEDQSDLILNNTSTFQVNGDVELSDQASLFANESSVIVLEGDLNLDNQSSLSMNGSSRATFNGDVVFEGGATISITENSELTFNSSLRIRQNGTNFNVSGSSKIEFAGNVSLESGADVSLTGNSNLNFLGNLTFDNNNSTTWTNTQSSSVFIDEGNFSKGINSYLTIRNSGIFEICSGTFPTKISNPRIITDPSPAYYGGCRILPVEYLYFNVSLLRLDRTGELTWVTAKEWESSHFEIERSVNNVESWKVIDLILGSGYTDSPVEYRYKDQYLPVAGGNIFYRLKQVDFDGNSTYSVTKSIQVNPMNGTTNWRVYPNPTTGDPINLEMLDTGDFRDEKITVSVFSQTGLVEIIEGASANHLSAQLSNILRSKAAGIYTLAISWGDNREYHKLILRH